MDLPNTGPKGLGGWLVLPAIGMIIAPLITLNTIGSDFFTIFTSGSWEALTTPGTEAYHWLWKPTLIYEIVGNVGLIIFDLVLLVLFFTKSHRFPTLYIALLISNVLFVMSDLFLAMQIPVVAGNSDFGSLRELIRAAVGATIWIPYMLVSKRVKNTFVKPQQYAGGSMSSSLVGASTMNSSPGPDSIT